MLTNDTVFVSLLTAMTENKMESNGREEGFIDFIVEDGTVFHSRERHDR